MARYIDAEALLKHYKALANIEWNKKVAPASWSDAYEEVVEHLEGLPTADVVPKSEVEKWFRECEELQGRMIELEAIKMSLENVLMLIGNYEKILIIEGKLAFVDKHIYTGLNSDFFTFCRENKLHNLRQRTVTSIECGVNVIYIFIEKENTNETH